MKKFSVFMLIISFSSFLAAQNTEFDKAISKHRKGKILIYGEPESVVNIIQQKHEFWFGCAISSAVFSQNSKMDEETKETYKQKFLENFNSAVTENAVKWASMEYRRGEIDYQTPENIANWCAENDIPCRGHNLYWGIEKFVQPWVKELSDVELRAALKKRGTETAKRFKGKFFEYDLNNEMIHGNYYAERLGDGITKDMATWVLEGDANAKLWLNDYNILTGNRLNDFIQHAETLQKQGVPISGLGVQGHLHGDSFVRENLQNALNELAKLNLPIRITEFNVPGQRSKFYSRENRGLEMTAEEEAQKAKDIVDYYSICFAEPAVEGILMWGFWEGANWIPQTSMYKRDWSPTAALEAYKDLIFKTWWTNKTVKLDKNGKAELDAFFGDYIIKSGSVSKNISHLKANKNTEVKLMR